MECRFFANFNLKIVWKKYLDLYPHGAKIYNIQTESLELRTDLNLWDF